MDYDGKERWFLGVVVCRKPDSDTELVIHYDSEDKLILLIFQASRILLLNWLQPHQQIFLGKRIRQRFTNIEENDFWWEQRIVISQDLNNSWNFIANFFWQWWVWWERLLIKYIWSFSVATYRWLPKSWCSIFIILLVICVFCSLTTISKLNFKYNTFFKIITILIYNIFII